MSSTPRLGPLLHSGRLVFESAEEEAGYFETFEVRRLPVAGLVERAVSYGYGDEGERTVTFMDRVRAVPGFAWNFVDHVAL